MAVFQRFVRGKIRGTFRGKFNRAPRGSGVLIHFTPPVAENGGASSIVPLNVPLIVPQ